MMQMKLPFSKHILLYDEIDMYAIARLAIIWVDLARESGIRCSLQTDRKNSSSLSRFLLKIDDPKIEVDHIDRNICNFCRNNLRLATRQQQNMNQGVRWDNTSGYKGVNWNKQNKSFAARIQTGGKRVFLGYFSTAEDAAKAYDKAAKKQHKEFAFLNFPEVI